MAAIAPRSFTPPPTLTSNPNPQSNFTLGTPKFATYPLKQSALLSHSLSRVSTSVLCRSHKDNNSNTTPSDNNGGGNFPIQEAMRNVIYKLRGVVSLYEDLKKEIHEHFGGSEAGEIEDEDWSWDRWKRHFNEIDEQERIVSVLKSQLTRAINREDYEEAARLKVAIAAATTNDTVGKVISHLNKAIEEERYEDAAFVRDHASAGLVGWWAGVSEDGNDPYGQIIHISAVHGRYVARSYSPWQLATARDGAPLFEIFLTVNKKGEYKEQAVYLKRSAIPQDFPITSSKSCGPNSSLDPLDPTTDKVDPFKKGVDDGEDRDYGPDIAEGFDFKNISGGINPNDNINVWKVTVPGKLSLDQMSKVVEQIIGNKDQDDTMSWRLESSDSENDDEGESDEEQNEFALDSGSGIFDGDEETHITVMHVGGGGLEPETSSSSPKDLLRVPARLEKKGHLSFGFTVEEDYSQQVSGGNGQHPLNRKTKLQGPRSIDHIMLDLAKAIVRREKPIKVIRELSELLTYTHSQTQDRQPLSGSTIFNRIDIPALPDPLNGLYIGAHGLSSEVIQIRRKFGQWLDDDNTKKPLNPELYEYIEAVKLTGDPSAPAGQVAFRAKVGKSYELPNQGIILGDLGVVARYKGQGRLAELGFKNPRWVDGEVVILDGKHIKGGPLIGFVYLESEYGYEYSVFFRKLKLHK